MAPMPESVRESLAELLWEPANACVLPGQKSARRGNLKDFWDWAHKRAGYHGGGFITSTTVVHRAPSHWVKACRGHDRQRSRPRFGGCETLSGSVAQSPTAELQ